MEYLEQRACDRELTAMQREQCTGRRAVPDMRRFELGALRATAP